MCCTLERLLANWMQTNPEQRQKSKTILKQIYCHCNKAVKQKKKKKECFDVSKFKTATTI